MRRAGKIIYIILAMAICMIPSVGMIFPSHHGDIGE